MEKQPPKNRKITKFYQDRILEEIYRHPGISREIIAKYSNLGPAITYRQVKALKNRGLITVTGLNKSAGGRRTELLAVNPQAGYLIGAAIRKEKLIWVLTDFSGRILQRKTEKTAPGDNSQAVISKLNSGINKIAATPPCKPEKVYGVGIGIPGMLDLARQTGTLNIHISDWHNLPLKKMIEQEIDIPVFLESNSMLAALAENRFGQGQRTDNFISLNVSFGISMGIIINGTPCRGVQGRAGEAGHIQIKTDGPYCSCGNRGCLESLAAIPALIAQAKKSIAGGVISEIMRLTKNDAEKIDLATICQAFKNKDKLACNLMQTAADNLGLAIGNIINIINPEKIIVGGELVEAGDDFLKMLVQATEKIKFQPDTKAEIVYSKLPWPYSIAMGGIALIQQKIFIDKEIEVL